MVMASVATASATSVTPLDGSLENADDPVAWAWKLKFKMGILILKQIYFAVVLY